MVKLGLALITMALLVACSSKDGHSLMNAYQKKQDYYKYLQKTEKVQLKENNITTLMMTVTYMTKPTLDIEDKSDEVFLIGLNTEDNERVSLMDDKLSVQLRNVKTKDELRVEKIKKSLERKARRKLEALHGKDSNTTLFLDNKKDKVSDKYLKPLSIVRVEKNSPLFKGISFVSQWSQFYVIRFKHIAGNRLTLRIKSKKSEAQLAVEKEKMKAKLAKKKKINKTSKKAKKSKKIKKPKLYNVKTVYFAKVAKYAL